MTRLCSTHVLDHYAITNVDSCFKMVGRAFDGNEKVIEAARVGDGYEDQLKEIMNNELLSIVEDIDKKLNTASECFPPCGFQGKNAVYNCVTCKYDSCEFPLDCPVKEMQVEENNRTRMMCDVPFRLPKNVEVVWRFAEEVKTQKVTLFEDVTTGVDVLYSIPATSLQHTGTYQCEIYSDGRSIVRLYFYLTVTPQVAVGHTELQEVFDLCLLPGGQLLPGSDDGPPSIFHPTLVLLTVCFTSVLLVIHLSLG
uniref:Ig-like domain-containing protein n=2 Tax=Takifugu TaxID=31032 RepID=A0A674MLX4_TAKRU